jgi:cytoskeleton protein RodZ
MSDPAIEAAADEPRGPGRTLAHARQARGMTVTEVALRLKFSPRQLEALEADRYDALPGPTMVRGMIRTYAKLIGMEAAPLLEALHRRLNAGPVTMQPRAMAVPFSRDVRRGSLVYVLLSAVVVVAVVSVVVEWWFRPAAPTAAPRAALAPQPGAVAATPAAPPTGPAAGPTPTPAAAPTPATAVPVAEPRPVQVQREAILSGKRIELLFDRESWVEIRDAEGRVVFSQLNPPGTRRNVQGSAPFSLVIGNATGVKLRYNNTDVDLGPFTRTDVARLTLE